jgi:hypothetical protein
MKPNRSLGAHFSKVRSINYDNWDSDLVSVRNVLHSGLIVDISHIVIIPSTTKLIVHETNWKQSR